jgi:hypothetical protein
MPALTQFYGLRPPDFDVMTMREVSEYRTQLQQYQAEQERSNRG